MESAAPHGGVLAAPRTAELIGDAVPTRDYGPVRAKGFADPVPATLVLPE